MDARVVGWPAVRVGPFELRRVPRRVPGRVLAELEVLPVVGGSPGHRQRVALVTPLDVGDVPMVREWFEALREPWSPPPWAPDLQARAEVEASLNRRP